jgi:hypothetical protein
VTVRKDWQQGKRRGDAPGSNPGHPLDAFSDHFRIGPDEPFAVNLNERQQ